MSIDFVFVVILYNKKAADSATIESLLKNITNDFNSKIIIWNNGNTCCEFDHLDLCGCNVELIDNRSNQSLAKIYNSIISRVNSNKYILLDDDSLLTKGYFKDLFTSKINTVCIPVITAGSCIISPTALKGHFSLGYLSRDTVLQGIGSGLALSRYIIDDILMTQDAVFDERFFLYGVDSVFFKKLFSLDKNQYISMIKGFEHDLSRLDKKNNTSFRIKERSYAFGLYCRYYPDRKNLISLLILTLKRIYHKDDMYSIKYIFKAILSGNHYRA